MRRAQASRALSCPADYEAKMIHSYRTGVCPKRTGWSWPVQESETERRAHGRGTDAMPSLIYSEQNTPYEFYIGMETAE